jgi:hypothetical protein
LTSVDGSQLVALAKIVERKFTVHRLWHIEALTAFI